LFTQYGFVGELLLAVLPAVVFSTVRGWWFYMRADCDLALS
jgi:hypothetical protein